jgi:hypothetical protein
VAPSDEQGPEVTASGLHAGHSAAVGADVYDFDLGPGSADKLASGPRGGLAARLIGLRGIDAPEAHGHELPIWAPDVERVAVGDLRDLAGEGLAGLDLSIRTGSERQQ